MKAILHTQYGPSRLLQFADVERPTPRDKQVLVKVHAASINAADYRILGASPFLQRLLAGGARQPKEPRIGSDVAGRVEAVGENVQQFRPGDEVFGCAKGSFAEYALAREMFLAPKPANVSFEVAAAVPVAALTALQGLRNAGGIQSGQKVLIQGASGGVGIFAVQLAKLLGGEVTAVCSTRNLDMVRTLGADHVIDYTQEDFTQQPQRYDLILAVNGYHPLSAYKRALTPQGTYICAGGTLSQFFQAMLLGRVMSREGGKTLKSMGIARVVQQDLVYLAECLAAGKITSIVDRRYPLNQVPEAIQYIEEKHAQGKVVITMV